MTLRGHKTTVGIGKGQPVIVNTNIGVTTYSKENFETEITKIRLLSNLPEPPDVMMDLSLEGNCYLYDYIHEIIGCPTGIIPIYKCIERNGNLSKSKLLDEMERAASSGVGWFTIHLTPNRNIIKKAITRKYPFSSRSAIICINDMIQNNREKSIYWEILDDIIKIVQKYHMAISLGAAFRSGSIEEAFDETHLEEYNEVKSIAEMFQEKQIDLMMEGVGHCTVKGIETLCTLLKDIDIPFMPLGPLFTNNFNNDDDIINAIGFFYGLIKCPQFNIINSITSSEHSGGIPTITEVINGYKTARASARMCNEYLGFGHTELNNNHCLNMTNAGCSRCTKVCPTKYFIENKKRIEKWLNMI
jgi:phosphomethylpyrimidine synthase